MKAHQIFREKIIDPVIKEMGLYSLEASDLLLGTALHESGKLKYVHQNGGPAMGMYQMEPNTLYDLFDNYLAFHKNKRDRLLEYREIKLSPSDPLNLYNPRYATAAARLQYYRSPDKIPSDADGQARMWKSVWNTAKGAGTVEQYLEAWRNR